MALNLIGDKNENELLSDIEPIVNNDTKDEKTLTNTNNAERKESIANTDIRA